MKKRILALALCLVMLTSLLPITAAAKGDDIQYCFTKVCITGTGLDYVGGKYELKVDKWTVDVDGDNWTDEFGGEFLGLYQDAGLTNLVTDALVEGKTYYLGYQVLQIGERLDGQMTVSSDLSSADISLAIPGFTASYDKGEAGANDRQMYCKLVFQVTKNHEHSWQFKQTTDSTLTGYCGGANCDIKEVSVSLKADPVTLPTSPFDSPWLDGWEAFKQAVPSANYDPNSFDYKLNGEPVTDKSNPKTGKYQVGIQIDGLPGNVEYEGVAARADMSSAYLFTQYTAVDPKVTAQTGDSRPIELMMAGVAVFSALAAAAFVADSKRKYQQ